MGEKEKCMGLCLGWLGAISSIRVYTWFYGIKKRGGWNEILLKIRGEKLKRVPTCDTPYILEAEVRH